MIKVAAAGAAAIVLTVVLLMAAVTGLVGQMFGGGAAARAAPAAVAGVPADYLALYTAAAATCPGLHWSILAAIGRVESDHGRSTLPGVRSGSNSAGAQGPMQFLPATFAEVTAKHPPPPGGATPPSPFNPSDAIHSAAMYLCDNGARDGIDLPRAIFTYNRAQWYVDKVLATARDYAASAPAPPGAAAEIAISYALSQLGQPYVWGGDGPDAGEAGFDCSGLVKAAYGTAGIQLPRVAHDQYRAGPVVPPDQPLQPGDLVFYGTPADIHHVALYIGDGQMVTAPRRGQPVKIAPYRYPGDDYYGATRPAPAPAPPPGAPPAAPVPSR